MSVRSLCLRMNRLFISAYTTWIALLPFKKKIDKTSMAYDRMPDRCYPNDEERKCSHRPYSIGQTR
jgi:hypothetical protein